MLFADGGSTHTKIYNTETQRVEIIPTKEVVKDKQRWYYFATGHSTKRCCDVYVNELIALAYGGLSLISYENFTLVDIGSRDMKYVRCVNRQVEKMDWNPSCGGNMGFTVELLGSYYDINFDTLKPSSKPVPLTCGLLGIERIFDVINNGISPEEAIAMFLCGLARQAYSFCGSPEVIHLSGGFTRNRCFVATLQQYCKVSLVGRYMLVRGLLEIARKEHGLDLSALIMSASSRRNLTRIIM